MMVSPDAGSPIGPAIRRSIKADFDCGVLNQEGDTVSNLKSLKPPLNIISEGLLEINTVREFSRPPFSCQNSVDEERPGKQHYSYSH